MARLWVGVTDGDWLDALRSLPNLDELNFWQPSPHPFRALSSGGLFLFKPHRRAAGGRDVIVGGGFFATWTRYPLYLAWEAFGEKNGAKTLNEMRNRIARYRREPIGPADNPEVGCILLEEPFFLSEEEWISLPEWPASVQTGMGHELESEIGRTLISDVEARFHVAHSDTATAGEALARYGTPRLVRPRLGQGSFRMLVTDAYRRRCAITGERVLPVLAAAHIRPYAEGGEHRVDNGLLLRTDLHTLFDRGYVTVTPQYHLEVSRRIQTEFNNGEEYYRLHGRQIVVPDNPAEHPARSSLEWHNETKFVA